jgi:hypothetical protein
MTRSSKETHMKMTKTLMVTVLAAAGLAAASAEAQNRLSRGSGGHGASAGASFGDRGGRGNWSGHHNGGGNWSGHHNGGHWHGGYGSRYWGPRYGFYFGAPILLGSYWGSPWWDDYYYPYYPRSTVVYRERIVEPYPASYPEYEVSSTEIVPRAEGAPTQAPAYRNYCESAKAYYPKVTTCPEGWRFEPTR